jgi:hypothetical protein
LNQPGNRQDPIKGSAVTANHSAAATQSLVRRDGELDHRELLRFDVWQLLTTIPVLRGLRPASPSLVSVPCASSSP